MADLAYIPVDPPRVTPPRHSLLASAEEITSSERWIAGFAFEPFDCGTNGGTHFFCNDNAPSKTIADGRSVVEYSPYVAWYGDKCSAATFMSRDFVGRATAAFQAAESAVIAAELWDGDVAQAANLSNPYFADGNADSLGDGFNPVQALATLQYELGQVLPGRGMIHAPRDVASVWLQSGIIRREGVLLLDAYDNIVVADTGYRGASPDGTPRTPTTAWVYATDPVQVRRDPQVTVLPDREDYTAALDRDVNLIEWRVERLVAAYWAGCAQLAIGVDLCSTDCSTPS